MTDPAQSFKFNSARDHYDDMKFSGQESLNRTFGAITRNPGKDFAGVITYASYGQGSTYTPAINRNGDLIILTKLIVSVW